MPTGYTAGVANGTITTFREYAMQCARAFGACIMLRDEPISPDIPEFTPSDYHEKEIARAKQRLAELQAMSETEIQAAYSSEKEEAAARLKRTVEEQTELRKRYEAMLEKARQFVPPNTDFTNFAAFLVSQLTESMRFDLYEPSREAEMTPAEWHANQIEAAEKSVVYHTEEHAREVQRTRERNEWVAQLREAVAKVPE